MRLPMPLPEELFPDLPVDPEEWERLRHTPAFLQVVRLIQREAHRLFTEAGANASTNGLQKLQEAEGVKVALRIIKRTLEKERVVKQEDSSGR